MDEARALTYVGERLRERTPGGRLEWVQTATFGDQGAARRWLLEGGADRRLVTSAHRLALPPHLRTGQARRFHLRRKAAVPDSLYTRLGEEHGIRAAVDDFYVRVLGDRELVGYFERLSEDGKASLRWHMVTFLAAATGGPRNYNGRDLTTAHAHLGIRPEHFDRVAGHLVATLRKLKAAPEDVTAVEAAVMPLKAQIVSAS